MSNIISMAGQRGEFKAGGRWAPTANVSLAAAALEQALHRSANLPGMVVLYGPSGGGKSMAASYCANKFEGVYVECRSYFTRKTFVEAILKEMGVKADRTLAEMMEQAAEQLDLSQRPLIIDEMDHLVDKNAIEIVRDLHEMCHATMLLIGEDQFPGKLLRRSERFHNRVLHWLRAQPTSIADCRQLARFYVRGAENKEIAVADDLQQVLLKASGALARRVCVNLEKVRQHCAKQGLKQIDLETWGKRPFYTGEAPRRRPGSDDDATGRDE